MSLQQILLDRLLWDTGLLSFIIDDGGHCRLPLASSADCNLSCHSCWADYWLDLVKDEAPLHLAVKEDHRGLTVGLMRSSKH